MRVPERIPIVMSAIVDTKPILERWLKESGCDVTKENRNIIRRNSWQIYKYWMENPNQRFGQVLFNMGLTPDGLYHEEETTWLVDNNFVRKQEVTFWGTYGLKPKKFKETTSALIAAKPKQLDYDFKDEEQREMYGADYHYWQVVVRDSLKMTQIPISTMSSKHIKNVMKEQPNNAYRDLFEEELKFRKELGIK